MKNLLLVLVIISLIICSSILYAITRSGKPRILVFSKTTGFRHASIPAGKLAIMKLGSGKWL